MGTHTRTHSLGRSRPAAVWQLVKGSSQAAEGLITEQWWKVRATGSGQEDAFNSLTYYGSGWGRFFINCLQSQRYALWICCLTTCFLMRLRGRCYRAAAYNDMTINVTIKIRQSDESAPRPVNELRKMRVCLLTKGFRWSSIATVVNTQLSSLQLHPLIPLSVFPADCLHLPTVTVCVFIAQAPYSPRRPILLNDI